MKKNQVTKVLGALCLCFAIAGGVNAVTANAEGEGVVSIENDVLKIDNVEVTATSANFATWEKASVRYDSTVDPATDKEYTGMRFLSWINQDVYDALTASPDYKVSFGTLIANKATVSAATAFTKDGLPVNTDSETNYKDVAVSNVVAETNEKSGQTDVVEFSAVMYGTTGAENFAKERMARAYMTVTSVADETQSVTIYANYNAEESRSIANVAMGALEANEYDKVDEEEKEFNALTTYAKASTAWKTGYNYMRWISTLEELQTYAPNAGTYLTMKNDISMAEVKPSDWDNYHANNDRGFIFSVIPELNAMLDGNNKKLHGLTLTGERMVIFNSGNMGVANNVGCFGIIGASGGIKNLAFMGSLGSKTVTVKSDGTTTETLDKIVNRHIGLLAWKNQGTIENMYVQGQIISGGAKFNNGKITVGMVFINTGTIRGVMSDIRFERLKGSSATTTPKADSQRFSFVVSNQGEKCQVSNCIALNEQYAASEITNTWTTSSIGTWTQEEGYDGTSSSWGRDLGNSNGVYDSSSTDAAYYEGYANLPALNTAQLEDKNRAYCYIFNTYEDLLAVDGTNGKLATTGTTNETGITGATAQNALKAIGGAWSFDAENGVVKLGDTVVWKKQA